MSQKFGKRRILNRPVTVGELIDVLQQFERQTDQKIRRATTPLWKKLWFKFRTKGRKDRAAQGRVARSEAGKPSADGVHGAATQSTPGSGD